MKLLINEEKILDVCLSDFTHNSITFELNGKKYQFDYCKHGEHSFQLMRDSSAAVKIYVNEKNGEVECSYDGQRTVVKEKNIGLSSSSEIDAHQFEYYSPMPGKISKIIFSPGQAVKKGDVLLYLEAMKMEHPIKAKMDGTIEVVSVVVGGQVNQNQLLIKLKKA